MVSPRSVFRLWDGIRPCPVPVSGIRLQSEAGSGGQNPDSRYTLDAETGPLGGCARSQGYGHICRRTGGFLGPGAPPTSRLCPPGAVQPLGSVTPCLWLSSPRAFGALGRAGGQWGDGAKGQGAWKPRERRRGSPGFPRSAARGHTAQPGLGWGPGRCCAPVGCVGLVISLVAGWLLDVHHLTVVRFGSSYSGDAPGRSSANSP